ncbi:hypothetical protein EBS02_12925 [bacterium]|nr:hypothetical protein [bacterium]
MSVVSIERQLEDSLALAISVPNINIYKSDYSGTRLLPSITIQAKIGSEEISPYSGVFKCPITLAYSARADETDRGTLDLKWYNILQTFYQSPTIENILTTSTLKVFQCKVMSESPGIITDRRIWTKTTILDIICTSK